MNDACYRCNSTQDVHNVYRQGGQPIDGDPSDAFGEEFTVEEETLVGPMCRACYAEIGTLIR